MIDIIGQSLGQYRVAELIGQGGMARVYKAYQKSLDRYVAIKAISSQADQDVDSAFMQRFATEARLVAKLAHPHIVPVFDFGEDQGWAYIVMEYISGGTVRDRMIKADAGRTTLPLLWTLTIMEQAAEALYCAHKSNIVHRDVKPGNMLLRGDDQMLLSDFGIATMLEASQAFSRTNSTVGTPQYMAPEQGLPNGVVDARTDVYALGVVLFQCVTGRLPYTADTPVGIIMKHIQEPTPQPIKFAPSLPPSVNQIIMRAMEKDQRNRFQSAAEMASALRGAINELSGLPRPALPTGPRPPQPQPFTGVHQIVAAPRGVPGAPGTCFRCGAANNPANHFCTSCGYDLTGARAAMDRVIGPSGRPLRCRLTFRTGPLTGQNYILHQDTTTIGRTAGNDIIVPDGAVSRYHARIIFMNGQWVIEDLQSANGSWIDDVRVNRLIPLESGDQLRFGDDIATFEVLS